MKNQQFQTEYTNFTKSIIAKEKQLFDTKDANSSVIMSGERKNRRIQVRSLEQSPLKGAYPFNCQTDRFSTIQSHIPSVGQYDVKGTMFIRPQQENLIYQIDDKNQNSLQFKNNIKTLVIQNKGYVEEDQKVYGKMIQLIEDGMYYYGQNRCYNIEKPYLAPKKLITIEKLQGSPGPGQYEVQNNKDMQQIKYRKVIQSNTTRFQSYAKKKTKQPTLDLEDIKDAFQQEIQRRKNRKMVENYLQTIEKDLFIKKQQDPEQNQAQIKEKYDKNKIFTGKTPFNNLKYCIQKKLRDKTPKMSSPGPGDYKIYSQQLSSINNLKNIAANAFTINKKIIDEKELEQFLKKFKK